VAIPPSRAPVRAAVLPFLLPLVLGACDESALTPPRGADGGVAVLAPPGSGPAPGAPPGAKPSAEEAARFVDRADAELKRYWTQAQRAAWINENFITDDTDAQSAAAEEATMEFLSRTIPEAARFDGLSLPDDVARKLKLLKLASVLPAPKDAQKRAELATIAVEMKSAYGKGKYCPERLAGTAKPCLALDDLSRILAESRDEKELRDAWLGWHAIAPAIKPKFARYVELGNEGAREIGFSDLSALWKAGYDMSAEAFEKDTDRLWEQVKPLYEQLHCYARGKLQARYGEAVPATGPMPAHLFGNMWAQEWSNIYPLLEPFPGQQSLDVTKKLKDKKLDEKAMVKIGEAFFTSLGMEPLPETFWERSLFKKPADREVVCHASAWDLTYDKDIRIKMCIEINEEDLYTIHHELGHNYYYVYYHKLPVLFQAGANDGFHEGIGDTLALSVTPGYLKSLGLLDAVPDNPKAEINQLFKMALSKVAFLPFGKLIDQWRWDVFSGKTKPDGYNAAWWALRQKYQGIAPPAPRSENDFDPGAKFHVPANTPYTRYFLSTIYQFQFHRALCKAAGHTGPLTSCSIHGSKAAGEKLRAMLAMGASRPWPEALAALSGETQGDANALIEYFQPLHDWLKEQNQGKTCGW
jgi:peptidyl-dipeptidase A